MLSIQPLPSATSTVRWPAGSKAPPLAHIDSGWDVSVDLSPSIGDPHATIPITGSSKMAILRATAKPVTANTVNSLKIRFEVPAAATEATCCVFWRRIALVEGLRAVGRQ